MMNARIGLGLLIVAVALALFFTPSVSANNFPYDGQVSGEYTYHDGWWWKGDVAYERVSVPYVVQSYDRYTCRYCNVTKYRWEFRKHHENLVLESERWREQLLKIAADRDRVEGQLRKSAVEQNEMLETIQALGLEKNFHWNGYGQSPTYAAYDRQFEALYSQQYPTPQGQTVFGYSSVADVYGDHNLGALYEQAIRLASDVNSYGAQATQSAQGLVYEEGRWRARVAEILARGQAARELAAATRPEGEAHLESHRWILRNNTQTPGPDPGYEDDTRPELPDGAGLYSNLKDEDLLAGVNRVITQSCIACHGGDEVKGNLDLGDLSKITDKQADSILTRIESDDPKRWMPKDHPRLSFSDREYFHEARRRSLAATRQQ